MSLLPMGGCADRQREVGRSDFQNWGGKDVPVLCLVQMWILWKEDPRLFKRGGERLTPPEGGWGQVLGAPISTSLRTSHLTQERPLWVGGPPQEQGEEDLSSDESGVRCLPSATSVHTAGRAVELAHSFIQRQRNEPSRERESTGKYRRPSVSKGDWFQDTPRVPNSEDAQIPQLGPQYPPMQNPRIQRANCNKKE